VRLALSRPGWMRPSAQVDLAQVRCSIRPVMRSETCGRLDRCEVRQWARRAGLFVALDRDGFFAMSPRASSVRRVLRIDARPGRHTMALGRALGYPVCCCLAARRRNDEGLDDWARGMARRRFAGLFHLIDPAGYAAGRSAISHIPCSPRCSASLRMALLLLGRRVGGSKPRSAVRASGVRPLPEPDWV
jgi:hypothetical protein